MPKGELRTPTVRVGVPGRNQLRGRSEKWVSTIGLSGRSEKWVSVGGPRRSPLWTSLARASPLARRTERGFDPRRSTHGGWVLWSRESSPLGLDLSNAPRLRPRRARLPPLWRSHVGARVRRGGVPNTRRPPRGSARAVIHVRLDRPTGANGSGRSGGEGPRSAVMSPLD